MTAAAKLWPSVSEYPHALERDEAVQVFRRNDGEVVAAIYGASVYVTPDYESTLLSALRAAEVGSGARAARGLSQLSLLVTPTPHTDAMRASLRATPVRFELMLPPPPLVDEDEFKLSWRVPGHRFFPQVRHGVDTPPALVRCKHRLTRCDRCGLGDMDRPHVTRGGRGVVGELLARRSAR